MIEFGDPRLPLRFWGNATQVGECWLWTGDLVGRGYGRISIDGKRDYAHRWSYICLVGKIPTGLVLDHHVCYLHHCVNPIHMEPVTNGENVRRGGILSGERRRVCMNGHAATSENTYVLNGRPMGCLICRRRAARDYYHQRRVNT